jgi:hypothetical protein
MMLSTAEPYECPTNGTNTLNVTFNGIGIGIGIGAWGPAPNALGSRLRDEVRAAKEVRMA